jgi:cytochrome c peroxidase
MKKLLLAVALCFVFLASRSVDETNIKVKNFYLDQLNQIEYNILLLKQSVLSKDKKGINSNYKKLRHHFKQIEFLIAHSDKEFYLKVINGAPLPKLEKKAPEVRIILPSGLQVIDELVADENFSEILPQLDQLSKNFKNLKEGSVNLIFSDEFILAAIHYQLIRDYTLGLTGFDTPGTLCALTDVQNSIKGVLFVLSQMDNNVPEKLVTTLQNAQKFVEQNRDFNTFDRARYYKEIWQPSFESLVSTYNLMGVKILSSTRNMPLEINFNSTQLFDTDLFNIQAFIDFNKADYNENSVSLGERLFFETGLSSNGKMACATCHNPSIAFTDGLAKSKSSNGESTVSRNAPTLLNSVLAKRFFYDLRAEKLSLQFEHVVFSDDEFNTTLLEIFQKLGNDNSYILDFKKAFPAHNSKPINIYTFKTALSSYLVSLTKFDSEFDSYMKGQSELDANAVAGYNLFMGKAACGTCHFAPTFSGLVPPYYDETESEVLGVPADKMYKNIDSDMGRYSDKLPKEKVDFYKYSFKTVTARHSQLTGPYMHNGVFDTLEEVMTFYNNGGGVGHGFELKYQTLGSDSLQLSEIEQKQIIAFLSSLD